MFAVVAYLSVELLDSCQSVRQSAAPDTATAAATATFRRWKLGHDCTVIVRLLLDDVALVYEIKQLVLASEKGNVKDRRGFHRRSVDR